MAVVGFDFGTTNSLISVIVGDRAINILDEEDLPVPSVVRYEGETVIAGRRAKEALDSAGIGVHGNIVSSPKTFLGEESVHVGGVERSPVDIVHDVVRHVKDEALNSSRRANLDGVKSAVVTIPVDMNGRRRSALRDAFRRADIGIAQFVHEPFAALYGYFRSQDDMAAAIREYDRHNILVVDWGGGTLDLTLCRMNRGNIVQIMNSGTGDVGGDHFDEAIRAGVTTGFCNEAGIAAGHEVHPDARLRLLRDSERHKIDLSSRDSVRFYRPGYYRDPDVNLEYLLTRKEMEEMTRNLVQTGLDRITALLDAARIDTAQVALVLVTGGMAAMPAIGSRINELFGPQRVKVPANSGTLIAEGAAWIAHDRQQLRLARTVELNMARGSYLPLIPANTPMPTEQKVHDASFQLYCTDPRDGSAKFRICTPARPGTDPQAGDPRTDLGYLVVTVDARTQPFRERLELDLKIDDDLILHAHARSLNVNDERRAEFHDLQFGISLPGAGDVRADAFDDGDAAHHEPGDLTIRPNVADERNDSLVPGDLIHVYKKNYLDRRMHPPQVQVEEFVYPQPCARCGKPSSDPSCTCFSDLLRRS
jgi:molecular chaperone DnaK (HSP70)